MKTLKLFIRALIACVYIILQQALIIVIAFLVYAQSGVLPAAFVLIFCLPMLYVNRWTWKYMMKYGAILLHTANADTSEIDVPKEQRIYRKDE